MKRFTTIALLIIWAAAANATELSNLPLATQNAVQPNIIFGLDDSGSMDFEVALKTNDGALWWNSTAKSFTDGDGMPLFNPNGTGNTWFKYVYLFPNGLTAGGKLYGDSSFYAIPATPNYAFMRSPDYNPIYYDPSVTYVPWVPAYISNADANFSNASPTAARSHPLYSNPTVNLAANLTTTANEWTFRMLPGMVIPGASIAGIKGKKNNNNNFQNITSNYTIPNNETWDVSIPYYPATYYLKDTSCRSGANCFTAPDGSKLRRYEIKPGNSFPSGRSYTDELQNFANWYTYYRKRKLMLSSAMGVVLSQLRDMRAGIVRFSDPSPVTMYDFNNASSHLNAKALLGIIYTAQSTKGTPTRSTLDYIGKQFMRTDKPIIEYACQNNAAMILTDGFAENSGPNTPSYNPTTWGNGRPYTPIFANSLADIALAYFTNNLRPDLPTGKVPVDTTNTSTNADRNINLHMNTYAFGLGIKGTIYGTGTPQANNPFTSFPNWPNPNVNYSPTAVDDLWHATINGRGIMFDASSTNDVINALQNLIAEYLIKAGAGSAITVTNVNVDSNGNNIAYASSYNGYTGDLRSYTIDINSGQLTLNSQWSARDLLNNRTPGNRFIATYNGATGIPFQWGNLLATQQSSLNSSISPPGPSDGQSVLAWIRGNKGLEGLNYRIRAHLLGDIVNADPILVKGATANYYDNGYGSFVANIANRTAIIYQGANDGMLHAFNAVTGSEVWAYIPKLLFGNLNALASKTYSHLFYVDAAPTVSDIYYDNGWHTMLVGGLRAGGKGYYALDVTNPNAANDANVAAKVLWEFPNSTTANSVAKNIGYSYGKPIIAKTRAAGWVVLVSSGYNNTTGDGRGHLFVLDPRTGAVLKDITTPVGSAADPSGLAHISAFANNSHYDATIEYVYGGDLKGNLWRFDLSGDNISSWNVKLLATLLDPNNTAQPITHAPELATVDNKRMVFVGTGQLLGESDLSTTQTQSMYALVDNLSSYPTITSVRTSLKAKIITDNTIDSSAIDYNTYRGWYFDLPGSGERVNTDPVIVKHMLIFNTNQPSAIACSTASYEYIVDIKTGGQVTGITGGDGQPVARIAISNSFASKPTIIILPNGQVKSIIHNADHTISVINLPPNNINRPVQRVAWKEIFRN